MHQLKNTLRYCALAVFCFSTHLYAIGDLQMPRINLIDKFGVNMATGQVTTHLDTLSIGGEMGLTHAIDGFTNNFIFIGGAGYQDKYAKTAKYRIIGERTDNYDINTGNPLYALTVADFTETKRFVVMKNDVIVPKAPDDLTSGFTYAALEDNRHTLEIDPDDIQNLKWTKADGTLVYFKRAAQLYAGTEGTLIKIIYPNGFTLTLDDTAHSNVRTNTGFQLHYEFAGHNTTMDKQDTFIEGVTNNVNWARNPTRVIGINASIESCATNACALTQNWPTTTFTWPGGMPKTLYINYPISATHSELESGIFSVKDAQGKTTEYHFRAEDLRLTSLGESISVRNPPYVAPRLAGIKTADSKVVNIKYSYDNIGRADSSPGGGAYAIVAPDFVLATEVGQIATASKNGEFNRYDINSGSFPNIRITSAGPVKKVVTNAFFGGNLHMPGDSNANTFEVETLEGGTAFENSWRNVPVVFRSNSGYYESYDYDGRGNIQAKLRVNADKTRDIRTTASYPTFDECKTTLNLKTCNQPKTITDADGKTTAYQYHAESGQVIRIISPTNAQGIAPVSRYHYSQYRAKYFQSTGNKEDGTPIWLKDSEKTCINTTTTDDSCAGGSNDEVVKLFEYEHDNLLLTGTTITAYDPTQKQLITKRSCFQYDRLGNKIGETAPKAGLSRCTQ